MCWAWGPARKAGVRGVILGVSPATRWAGLCTEALGGAKMLSLETLLLPGVTQAAPGRLCAQ